MEAFLAFTAMLAFAIFCLRSLAFRQGGLNGDFLGASVVVAELITLAATLI
jgi:cobalamin synthase